MGKVGITMTLTLDSPEINPESVKSEVLKISGVQKDIRVEPLGFGLKCVKILIVRDDKEGGDTDAIEEEISKIKGVGSVRTDDVTLI